MNNKIHNPLLTYNFALPEKIWMRISLLIIVFAFTYFEAISLLVRTWLSRDDYSHGFLIPLLSLYFVYAERENLKRLSIQPNIVGGVILTLMGGLILLLGKISSVVIVQQLSIIVIIPGLVLMLLGIQYLKALSFPLCYLILMVPILDGLIGKIRWPFQLFSAKFSGMILQYLGIPVFQDMQYIELPHITIEIAEVCSGVNYLISILAIGIPIAYFTQRGWWRRIVLITFAVIVGILANVLRVTLIGIWTYNGGEGIHGPLHIFQGLFVSVVGFIFLFIGAWILAKIPSHDVKKSIKEKDIINNPIVDVKKFNQAWLTAIIILLSLGGYLYLYNPKSIPLKAPINELPLMIGNWKGVDIKYHKEPFRVQGADSELTRIYMNSPNHEVKLYIGYFESQRQDKELIHYRLQMFYEKTEEIEVPIGSHSSIRVNKIVLNDGIQNYLVLFWYDLNNRIVANRYKAKLITALDGLIHRRTNGAIIIVSSKLNHSYELKSVLNDEIAFVREILPVLDNYIP